MLVRLDVIAAIDDCMVGIDMPTVGKYRLAEKWDPIKLLRANSFGFHVIDDGHHRVMAALFNHCTHIMADVNGEAMELSWRWPRVAPVRWTFDLMKFCKVDDAR